MTAASPAPRAASPPPRAPSAAPRPRQIRGHANFPASPIPRVRQLIGIAGALPNAGARDAGPERALVEEEQVRVVFANRLPRPVLDHAHGLEKQILFHRP